MYLCSQRKSPFCCFIKIEMACNILRPLALLTTVVCSNQLSSCSVADVSFSLLGRLQFCGVSAIVGGGRQPLCCTLSLSLALLISWEISRVRDLLPTEFDEDKGKKNKFTVTHPNTPLPEMTAGGDNDDDDDYPESGIGASHNSLRNALSRSREDLVEDLAAHVGLDDQVLALARTARRGSISTKTREHIMSPASKQAQHAEPLSLSDLHYSYKPSQWRSVIWRALCQVLSSICWP